MKKIIFFIILTIKIVYANEINPVDFIQEIINECKPVLINKNNSFLEEKMEKYIDFNEVAIWITGKNIWQNSSPKKKDEFINEIKKLMLRTYSKTVYYYVDADVEFINNKNKKTDNDQNNKIQISSIMKKNNKSVIITYRLIKNENKWLVFDVIIEGISILKSLKNQYSEMIRVNGLEETIKKINNLNSQ